MFSARNRKPFISSPILWPRHELAIIYLATTIVVIQSELELEQLLCVHIWGNGVPHILNGKFVSNGQLVNVLVTWRPVAQHNRRSGMENFKLFVIHLWNELFTLRMMDAIFRNYPTSAHDWRFFCTMAEVDDSMLDGQWIGVVVLWYILLPSSFSTRIVFHYVSHQLLSLHCE